MTIVAPQLFPDEDDTVREVMRRVFYRERVIHVVRKLVLFTVQSYLKIGVCRLGEPSGLRR